MLFSAVHRCKEERASKSTIDPPQSGGMYAVHIERSYDEIIAIGAVDVRSKRLALMCENEAYRQGKNSPIGDES